MDPEEDDGGGGGGYAAASPARSSDTTTRPGASGPERSGNVSPTPIILRISPAEVGKQRGYIHLASGELADENAIRAYFDSVGREVMSIPCPDFEGFLLAHSLRTRNISFLSDLPEYILQMGGCQHIEVCLAVRPDTICGNEISTQARLGIELAQCDEIVTYGASMAQPAADSIPVVPGRDEHCMGPRSEGRTGEENGVILR